MIWTSGYLRDVSPIPQQPVRGSLVVCTHCGRIDNLWFCDQPQPSQNGSGQYVWQWTRCCHAFMKIVPTDNHYMSVIGPPTRVWVFRFEPHA